MKKLCTAVLVLGLAISAPLTSFAVTIAGAGMANTVVTLSDSAAVRDIEGLTTGGRLWYQRTPLIKGYSFKAGTFSAKDFTVTLPDATYSKLTLGKPFEVTVWLDSGKRLTLTFTPERSNTNTVVLETTTLVLW